MSVALIPQTHTVSLPAMPSGAELTVMKDIARQIVASQLFPQFKNEAQVVAIVMTARELRIPPMFAANNIHMVSNRPTLGVHIMTAVIQRDHGDDALIFEESTEERCTLSYKRRSWQKRQSYTFTKAMADKAGTQNMAKHGASMLRARCVSAVAKMGFADSVSGMYVPEDFGAMLDEDGQLIEAPVARPTVTAEELSGKPLRLEPIGIHGSRSTPVPSPLAVPPLAEHTALVNAAKDAAKRANAEGATWTLRAIKKVATAAFGHEITALEDLTDNELLILTQMFEGYRIWDAETNEWIETASADVLRDDAEEALMAELSNEERDDE